MNSLNMHLSKLSYKQGYLSHTTLKECSSNRRSCLLSVIFTWVGFGANLNLRVKLH